MARVIKEKSLNVCFNFISMHRFFYLNVLKMLMRGVLKGLLKLTPKPEYSKLVTKLSQEFQVNNSSSAIAKHHTYFKPQMFDVLKIRNALPSNVTGHSTAYFCLIGSLTDDRGCAVKLPGFNNASSLSRFQIDSNGDIKVFHKLNGELTALFLSQLSEPENTTKDVIDSLFRMEFRGRPFVDTEHILIKSIEEHNFASPFPSDWLMVFHSCHILFPIFSLHPNRFRLFLFLIFSAEGSQKLSQFLFLVFNVARIGKLDLNPWKSVKRPLAFLLRRTENYRPSFLWR